MLLGGMVAFYSCDDDDNEPLSRNEAEELLTQTDGEVADITGEAMNSDGIKVVMQLSSMGMPEIPDKTVRVAPRLMFKSSEQMDRASATVLESSISPELAKAFEKVISYGISDYEGIWTWTPNGWSFEPSSSHTVVLKFPYPVEDSTNNATLTLYDYQTTIIEDYEEITALKAKIELNGVQVLSLTFSASYTPAESYDLSVKFGNFQLTAAVDYTLVGTFDTYEYYSLSNLEVVFKQGNATVFSLDVNLDINMLSEDNSSVKVNATLIIKSLKLKVDADFETQDLDFETNPDLDLNQFISIELFTTSGNRIGHFSIEFNPSTGETTVYFIFEDGTQVNAEELMPQLADYIQNLYEEYF